MLLVLSAVAWPLESDRLGSDPHLLPEWAGAIAGASGALVFSPMKWAVSLPGPLWGWVTCVRLLASALRPVVVLVLLLREPELRRLYLLKSSRNNTLSLRKNSWLLVGLCFMHFSHRLSHKDQGSLVLQELEPFIHKAETSILEQLLGKGEYFHFRQTPESVPVLSQGAHPALMLWHSIPHTHTHTCVHTQDTQKVSTQLGLGIWRKQKGEKWYTFWPQKSSLSGNRSVRVGGEHPCWDLDAGLSSGSVV